jgi:ribosomal protein S12 methylthiotransferase
MKVGVVSLGCVKNRVDTEEMLSFLEKDGFQFVNAPETAEVLIVNTCGFIASAKEESIEAIFEMAQYKKTGACRVLCVTGCLAQRYGDELLEQIPEIDVLTGVSQYPQLAGFINKALGGSREGSIERGEDFAGCGRVLTTAPYTAYVRIAEGCDNRCAYCAIPLIRGAFRSRPMGSVLSEMSELAGKGAREQVLIAQDTSRYGRDLEGTNLAKLLTNASDIPGIEWLRVLYCYPDETNRDLINIMAGLEKVCRYLDLPLQHASPKVLKRMRRRGGIGETEDLLLYARDKGFALRTTMIVGFPGETEQDFQQLMDFCARMRFDRLGAFAFSPEEDTPAYHMRDKIPEAEKQRRLHVLLKMQQQISLERNKLRIGGTDKVLITGVQGEEYFGRSQWEAPDSDGLIKLKSLIPLREGQMISTRITGASAYDLEAEAAP